MPGWLPSLAAGSAVLRGQQQGQQQADYFRYRMQQQQIQDQINQALALGKLSEYEAQQQALQAASPEQRNYLNLGGTMEGWTKLQANNARADTMRKAFVEAALQPGIPDAQKMALLQASVNVNGDNIADIEKLLTLRGVGKNPPTIGPRGLAAGELGLNPDPSTWTPEQFRAVSNQQAADRLKGERAPRDQYSTAYDDKGNLIRIDLTNPTLPPVAFGGGGIRKSLPRATAPARFVSGGKVIAVNAGDEIPADAVPIASYNRPLSTQEKNIKEYLDTHPGKSREDAIADIATTTARGAATGRTEVTARLNAVMDQVLADHPGATVDDALAHPDWLVKARDTIEKGKTATLVERAGETTKARLDAIRASGKPFTKMDFLNARRNALAQSTTELNKPNRIWPGKTAPPGAVIARHADDLLRGLGINPDTGNLYKEGDVVIMSNGARGVWKDNP